MSSDHRVSRPPTGYCVVINVDLRSLWLAVASIDQPYPSHRNHLVKSRTSSTMNVFRSSADLCGLVIFDSIVANCQDP